MAEEILSHQLSNTSRFHFPQPRPAEVPRAGLAVSEMTTYRWTFLDDIVGYVAAGIEAIGVWRRKLVEFGEERAIDLLGSFGLAVSSLSWAGGFTGVNGHSFRDAVVDAREALEIGRDLNADCLVVVSGPRGAHTRKHCRTLFHDGLLRLGDAAAELGVPLAVQPMHRQFAREWTFVNTLDETLEILDVCDHPWIRMAFNPFHLRDEARLIERIPEIVPHLAVVQLSDCGADVVSPDERCALGAGVLPLPEIVSQLRACGYRGRFEVDIWSDEVWQTPYPSLLARSRTYVDALLQKAASQPLPV